MPLIKKGPKFGNNRSRERLQLEAEMKNYKEDQDLKTQIQEFSKDLRDEFEERALDQVNNKGMASSTQELR